jgi:hypothetical protein
MRIVESREQNAEIRLTETRILHEVSNPSQKLVYFNIGI